MNKTYMEIGFSWTKHDISVAPAQTGLHGA